MGYRAKWVKGHDKWKPRPDPNPSGLCMCGCGQPAPIARRHDSTHGAIKGKPRRYIFGHYGRIPDPIPNPETGCWIWQGSRGTHGRGTAGKEGKQVLAYRLFYERHVGPIPDGHQLHHICKNPVCVNPVHLEPVTPLEHAARHAKAH